MAGDCTGYIVLEDGVSRTQTIESVIAFIREANEVLQQQLDLSPANQRVTDIVRRLSAQLRARYLPEEIGTVLSNKYIAMNLGSLQHKLSQAECLAELEACRRICQLDNSARDIAASLPNWDIYMALVGAELSTLQQFIAHDRQMVKSPIVFVGSGSMPLSPIILHMFGNVEVVCLEIESAAYAASRALLERLGLQSNVTVVLQDGAQFDYSSYSQIFIASLVRNKHAVLKQIKRTSPNSLVAVRTAEGMKQIMYESIDESLLQKLGWQIAARTVPDENLVINSTLFLNRHSS